MVTQRQGPTCNQLVCRIGSTYVTKLNESEFS